MAHPWSALRDWWGRHFLLYELLLVAGVVVAGILWAEVFGGEPRLNQFLAGRRADFYGVAATVSAALLGFMITTTTVIAALIDRPRLAIVRQSPHYPKLWSTLLSTVRHLSAALLVSLVGFLFDQDSSPSNALFYLTVFSFVISAARLARSIWVLENVVLLAKQEPASTPSVPTP